MDEINRKPLVDVLAELLGTQVVMDGDKYVTMVDNKVVADALVADALIKQEASYQEARKNARIMELKKLLLESDFKELPGYQARSGTRQG